MPVITINGPQQEQAANESNMSNGIRNMGAGMFGNPNAMMSGAYRRQEAESLAQKSQLVQAYGQALQKAIIQDPKTGQLKIDPTMAPQLAAMHGMVNPGGNIMEDLMAFNGQMPETNVKGGILGSAPQAVQYASVLPAGSQVSTAPNGDTTVQGKTNLRPIPQGEVDKITQNLAITRAFNNAIDKINQNPKEAQNALGTSNEFMPGWLRNNITDPAGVPIRGAVGAIGGPAMHALGGSAFTEGEKKLYAPFIAQTSDTPQAALDKLYPGQDAAWKGLKDQQEQFSPQNGYIPSTLLTKAFAGQMPAPTDSEPTPAANAGAPSFTVPATGGQPPAANAPAAQAPALASDPISRAKIAIAAGADPTAVKQRLQQAGIDPSGL